MTWLHMPPAHALTPAPYHRLISNTLAILICISSVSKQATLASAPRLRRTRPAASQVVRLRASVGAHNGQVLVKAAAPTATVLLLPLLPKRIHSTPLADALLSALQQSSRAPLESQSFSCASMQHGVLSLDQGRSLVPLHAAEAQVARDCLLKADRTCDICQDLNCLCCSTAYERARCRM